MDLHPLFDRSTDSLEFSVLRAWQVAHVEVSRSALQHLGVRDHSHGLLEAYDAHRERIDAAVIRKAAEGGIGIIKVRPGDLDGQLPPVGFLAAATQ